MGFGRLLYRYNVYECVMRAALPRPDAFTCRLPLLRGRKQGDVIIQADQDLDSFFPAAFHKQFTHDIYAFKSF
jgi:hypothetical protein